MNTIKETNWGSHEVDLPKGREERWETSYHQHKESVSNKNVWKMKKIQYNPKTNGQYKSMSRV